MTRLSVAAVAEVYVDSGITDGADGLRLEAMDENVRQKLKTEAPDVAIGDIQATVAAPAQP